MSESTELLTALTVKLNEVDSKLEVVSSLETQLGSVNLTQLEARVSTGENRHVETTADLQALQSLFNTDHYATLPALANDIQKLISDIETLKSQVAQNTYFIDQLKSLN